MTWRDAEAWLAGYLGGKVVTDRDLQLQDIDVIAKDTTWSVKLQKAAARYGNFSFELSLESNEGLERPGNFMVCETDGYCIIVPRDVGFTAYLFSRKELHAAVLDGGYPVKPLTPAVQATNGGRKYSKANNFIVPIKDVQDLALIVRID